MSFGDYQSKVICTPIFYSYLMFLCMLSMTQITFLILNLYNLIYWCVTIFNTVNVFIAI